MEEHQVRKKTQTESKQAWINLESITETDTKENTVVISISKENIDFLESDNSW